MRGRRISAPALNCSGIWIGSTLSRTVSTRRIIRQYGLSEASITPPIATIQRTTYATVAEKCQCGKSIGEEIHADSRGAVLTPVSPRRPGLVTLVPGP